MKFQFTGIFLLFSLITFAQVEEKRLDELVRNTIKTFDVPGMSFGLSKTAKWFILKGSEWLHRKVAAR